MSQVESCEDRQNNEYEVLKSIFGDELKDLRKPKHQKKIRWQPMNIKMTLTPSQGMSGPAQVYAQIDLLVSCGDTYPEDVPRIQLKDSRGLSNQQIAVLFSELEKLAETLKGEVMILELAQHVQKFLHEHNKPSYSSFYEEMVSRRQEKIQTEMQEKQLKEDKERQELHDEVQRRCQEALEAERDRKEKMARLLSKESNPNASQLSQSIPSSPHERGRNSTYSRRRCLSTSGSSDSSLLCEHRGTKLLHFMNSNKVERQVHRGKCLGHSSSRGSVVYAGVDLNSGDLLAIVEWTLKDINKTQANQQNHKQQETLNLQHYMKQIGSIEQELNHLHKMHHANLVHYENIKFVQDKNSIVIYIIQDLVIGTTCSFFLMENIPMAVDILRYVAAGVLSALEYLHENDIVHKDLRDSSVYINNAGIIKVADYSLNKRLSDLYYSINSCARGEPDSREGRGGGGKKLDIHKFGILMLSLLKGSAITGGAVDSKHEQLVWDLNIPQELKDFLSKCLPNHERSRWSAAQLQQHAFIRVPIYRELSSPPKSRYCDKEQINYNETATEEPASDFHICLPAIDGHSRIKNEFEILKLIGEGAFGDVWKVRNKLDGGVYAIKRIALNPKNKQLNKKMIREVKLLSRLNHENVVRYYNSWIENVITSDNATITETSTSTSENIPLDVRRTKIDDILELEDKKIEESLLPPVKDSDWTMSFDARSKAHTSDDDNSEDDDDDDDDDSSSSSSSSSSSGSSSSDDSDVNGPFLKKINKSINSSDSMIEFDRDFMSGNVYPPNEHSSKLESCNDTSEKVTVSDDNDSCEQQRTQFMYIQMEFCEKSTLRIAIDNGLYQDEDRVWRLFREMVEGIAYIHQQGMIHRDLKPVNIFLDSNDHVKIGDFGLATTNILPSFAPAGVSENDARENTLDVVDKAAVNLILDEPRSMTGQVGTALYVAPELRTEVTKARYNQKVDIYSLGIILFEMCYKPPETKMERVNILQNVRSKEIILPADMMESAMPHQVHLLRWLLNHDPSQRPTAQELLVSEYLPPPLLEEAELQEMVRHTLSNSESKAYKYLIACCFAQEVTPAEDITYDMNLPSRVPTITASSSPKSVKNELLQESVKAKVIEVFQRHGGVNLITPLLMPKSAHLLYPTESYVKLMTHSGTIVSIPHDLRAPFARYVVWNNVMHFRRYAVERVYREKMVHGFHPRELYECAFDIISTTPNLMAEAELIRIVWELFNEFPEIGQRNFSIRLNHTSLLQAVLMYCGIEPEKWQDIYLILSNARDGKCTKFQVQTHFTSLCLTDQAMETLSNLFGGDTSEPKIASVLKTITKRKGDAAILAKESLREIEAVSKYIDALGVKWSITIMPLLVYNVEHHSGIIFQITGNLKRLRRKKRDRGQEVIAAGGRYDKMLQSFRRILDRTGLASKEITQYGVGISISLDKLVCAIKEFSTATTDDECQVIEEWDISKYGIEVAVGYIDRLSSTEREHEFANLLREIWALGLRVTILDFTTTEEILDYCRENSIPHVIILRNNEKGNFRLQSWERDRFNERKISISDIADHLQRQTDTSLPTLLNRSESKINTINNQESSSVSSSNNPINVNFNFVLSERDKLSGSGRRSYKISMLAQMSNSLQRVSHKVPIEVFAVFLEMTVIKTIVSLLEIDEREPDLQKSIQQIIDKHPRHKKYVKQICDEMSEVRNEKSRPVLALYSLTDNKYMILM